MTLKDHCTRIGWLVGAAFVVHKLKMIMCFIGYPVIYHTDNGSKVLVKGAQIIAMLKDTNPSIVTVTGRVRRPSDQGSVEVVNSSVKAVIRHFETEAQQRGELFCWPNNLGKAVGEERGRASPRVPATVAPRVTRRSASPRHPGRRRAASAREGASLRCPGRRRNVSGG